MDQVRLRTFLWLTRNRGCFASLRANRAVGASSKPNQGENADSSLSGAFIGGFLVWRHASEPCRGRVVERLVFWIQMRRNPGQSLGLGGVLTKRFDDRAKLHVKGLTELSRQCVVELDL